MSINHSGMNSKVLGRDVMLTVSEDHPLLKLANTLSWEEMEALILPDLKATTAKKKWWIGRPLMLRVHLGIYTLQQLFNKTDRQLEYDIKDNGIYQLFCGRYIVDNWHCPDHTKIEEFRSRLSPATQQRLANHFVKVAVELGFANPEKLDLDSTVQEANMAYPSDVYLLSQLAIKAKKVWEYMQKRFSAFTFEPLKIDLKAVKEKVRACYFSKTKDKQQKNNLLSDLWVYVFGEVMDVVKRLEILDDYDFKQMPWNIRRLSNQLKANAHNYFIDVCKFLNKGVIEPTKRLSFHLQKVACFNKNKPNKKYQFGRGFQLGRIAGNFLLVGKNDSVRMEDKHAVEPMLQMHHQLFPKISPPSVATDKGYYSKKNADYLQKSTGSNIGLQKPGAAREPPKKQQPCKEQELADRRAGIEPLIGHAKHGGQLGKSRMKYDHTTESAGYAAIFGFNGRQLIRYLKGAAVFNG